MEGKPQRDKPDNSLTERFESMLKDERIDFFDVSEFEEIIDGYVLSNNFDKALRACQFGLDQHALSQEIIARKAQILAITDKTEKALKVLNDAPIKNEEILLTTAFILTQNEDYLRALSIIKKVELEYGVSTETNFSKGTVYMQNQDYENAIRYFKQSLSLDLENEAALYDLAFCLEVTGALEESIDFYQKFIDKDPYSHTAWYNLGIVYNKLEKHEDAIKAFEYANVIKDDFSSAYYNAANTYVNIENYKEAIKLYKKCLDFEHPSADIFAKIGECHEYLEEWSLAKDFYKKALELDHNKEEAIFGLGMTLYYRKRYTESIHYFKKAITQNSSHSFYWHMLAKAEFKLGNEASSIEAFEEANKLNTDDVDIWLDWAAIYGENKNYEGAIGITLAALNILPEEAKLHYMAFVYQIKDGNYKEAFKYLENALILNPEMHSMLYEYFEDLDAQKAITNFIDKLS